ncbi:MAG: right-handed parallel beta-helix repeat-containing protein, partial [Candidatus Methanofastidiosa archaeon]|nr:right-handed parallel beta-helix repeat-containing protein [Candidatus Methanofastidiosa archaeon]
MVILVLISFCTAFGSVGAISYDTVSVDDDGPSGGNHFTSLPTAYSAVSPGGTIHVAAGTYVLTSLLHISKDVAIIGAGADRVFIEGPVDTIALQVFNASLYLYGCTIRYAGTGVEVHCTDSGDHGSYLHKNAIYGTTGGDTGISFFVSNDTSLELVITDNDIYDNIGYGIAGVIGPGAAADVTIEDNRIYDNGGSGIQVKGSKCTYTLDFVGNEIWGNGEGQLNTGIDLEIEEPDYRFDSFVTIA